MSVNHHMSDELLLDYASGNLAEGWSLAVATHLSLCPHCRRRLKAMEAAAGILLEEEKADTSDINHSWQSMLNRLEPVALSATKAEPMACSATKAELAPKKIKPVADGPILPEPLRSYFGRDVDELKWKPLGRGAYHIPIKTGDKETSVRLLRIPAGRPVPEHSHGGRELTLVLKGSFHDETGHFYRGDFEETDETVEHQPIADDGEDCICLAVTDAPLRFKSRLLRFVQPVLGI